MADEERERYRDDLVDAQIELSERLRQAETPAQLTSLAEGLAETLRGVAGNERLWSDLETDADGELDDQQLFQLTLVDWEQVLLDRGVEEDEAGELAGQLIYAAHRAREGQASWGEVKNGLVALAKRLDEDAGEVKRRGWKGPLVSLRERVASGIAVLGHIKAAVSLKGAGEGLTEAAVPAIAAAVITGVAIPAGFPVICVAAGVVGLGWGAREAVSRGLGEVAAQAVIDRFRRLDVEFAGIREAMPDRQAELDEIERLGLESDETALDRIVELLSGLRSWAAGVGARIAAEWPFVVAHFGQSGARRLENATLGIANIRRSLKALSEAICGGVENAVQRAADTAGAALRAVERSLDEFHKLLVAGAYKA